MNCLQEMETAIKSRPGPSMEAPIPAVSTGLPLQVQAAWNEELLLVSFWILLKSSWEGGGGGELQYETPILLDVMCRVPTPVIGAC